MSRRFQFSLARLFAATVCCALAAISTRHIFYVRRIEMGEALAWTLTGCVSLGVAVAVLTQSDNLGVVAAIIAAVAIILFG
ncbi:MAG TPA: hypothetical protein VNH11_08530 [Pirellulales bacterium]|nr:hypothetical protein [Pirellulales bacterium]